jgi:branched-chain amino acid transport system ATP-binding protein
MLEVDDLHAFYGTSHVVQGVTFSIERGEGGRADGSQWRGQDQHAQVDHGPRDAHHGRRPLDGRSVIGVAAHVRAPRGSATSPRSARSLPI